MYEVILFEHKNFHGAHKHVVCPESNLNSSDDKFFNDKVSSLVVLSGNWAFYRDAGFHGQYAKILGPGLYSWVESVDIKNDDMSSLQPVMVGPSVHGAPIRGHVILYEHVNFHGAHKHVFNEENNLNAADDSFFNDRTSSLVITAGNWALYRDAGYVGQYAHVLGPGMYSWVGNYDIKNDDLSSLKIA